MDFKTIDYKDTEDLINKIKAITKNRSESLIILICSREYGQKYLLSKVLGHTEDSEASRNYANIKARTPAIATEPQARQALDKLENKINTLEDKVAGLNANLPKMS
eukprot:g77149.t1